jgi:hypothetical protein
VAPVYEARRYSIGEALVAAGAPIPQAQAIGTNYNARMQTATGLKAAAWLEERGWAPYGRKWCPPSADILD